MKFCILQILGRFLTVTVLVCALSSVLFAGSATASQDGTHFYLENDVLKIAVLRTNGSLDGIIHKQSGVNLQTRNVNNFPEIWGIVLNTPAAKNVFVNSPNTISFTGLINNSATGASLVLTWQGFRNLPNGVPNIPNVTVKAQISVKPDSPLSFWTIEVDGLGTNTISQITYPYISGIGSLGQSGVDDQLLFPQLKGTIFHDPTANPTGNVGGFYPSAYESMQMFAYFDQTSGFYFASDDTQGYTKNFWWGKSSSPAGDFTINMASITSGLPSDSVTIPYNMIVGVTQGDWYGAADIYRTWAAQQPWTQQSRTKQVPSWLHDMPLAREDCTHTCEPPLPNLNYANFIQDLQQGAQFFGFPAMGQLDGWEKYGAWVEGDYFPPQEGWSGFDAMVQGLRPSKLWLLPSALFLDTSTDLYKSGTMDSSAMLDPQGNQRTTASAGLNGGQWVFMDFSTDPWRQNIIDTYTTLAQHGADLIQFDSSMEAGPQDCYNPVHQHPPGKGGNWQTQAWIDIMQSTASAVSAANPSATFSAEEPAEIYLPYLSLHSGSAVDQSEVQFPVTYQEPVPLFQYVYHDSILFADFFGPPILDGSFFRLALARDLTWGQMPQYQIDQFPTSLDAPAQAYLQSAITARTTYAKKFLVDGVMLPAPQLSAPLTTVSWIVWSQNNLQLTGQYPGVQESAWRATDGSVGIIMTNIATNDMTFSLPVSYSRLQLASGTTYTVQTTDGSSTTVLDPNLVQDSAYSIKLKPQQILLVTLTQTTPQVSLSPSTLTFTDQLAGTTSTSQNITLTNKGTAALTITGVSVTGTNIGDFAQTNTCGSPMAVGMNCTIEVNFTPSAGGTRSASLTLTDNASDSPQIVSFTGTGLGATVTLSESTINFNSDLVGSSGVAQMLTLTNTGSATLTVSSIAITGTNSRDFTQTNTCRTSLAAGGNCAISVIFSPSASGTRSGLVTITDNAPGSPQTVTLTGLGGDFSLAPSSATSVTVAPGQTVSNSLSVVPDGGFNQSVAFACTGAPARSTCAVSPSTVQLNGSTSATVTVTVTTAADSFLVREPPASSLPRTTGYWRVLPISELLGVALVACLLVRHRERRPRLAYGVALVLLLCVGMMMSACGGGGSTSSTSSGSGGNPGTPAGSYTLVVTGTSSSLMRTTNFTLIVQ